MKTTNLCFRKAKQNEKNAVSALYRSAIGREGCTWNEFYPGEIELREDFETGNLYVLAENRGAVIGAVSVVHTNELDDLACWQMTGYSVREIARVVISEAYHGHRYSEKMLQELFRIFKAEGCRAVHLLVGVKNAAAQKVYRSLGFTCRAACQLYGEHYYAYEKILG